MSADLAGTDRAELAALTERLAAFDAAAKVAVEAVVVEHTRAAFEQDWMTWCAFCDVAQIPVEAVSSGVLAAFVGWLTQDHPDDDPPRPPAAPSTIARRLTGVLDGWKRRDLDVPHGITTDARKLLKAYARDCERNGIPVGRGKAPALTLPQLAAVLAALPDTNTGARDRALFTVGYGIAARRSETARLLVSDITVGPAGIRVSVRASKGGTSRTPLIKASNRPTDARRAWLAWSTRCGIASGPAFRRITPGDRVLEAGLSPAAVGEIITRRTEAVGIYGVTGHSVRSGLATESRRAGKRREVIARQGGWKDNSAILYGYLQTVDDEGADNATDGVL